MLTVNYSPLKSKNYFDTISVINISYVKAASDPNWSFQTHSHPDSLELSYVFSGQSALYCDKKFYETRPGDIIIKNAHVMHAEKTDINEPIEQICIGITGICLENMEPNCLISEKLSPIISLKENKDFFDALFRQVISLMANQREENLLKINSILSSVLNIMYVDYFQNIEAESDTTDEMDISHVIKYIEDNYFSELSIDNLAKKFFISPFYLSKKFKAQTGFTINQYIISCRMGEAQRLLIFSDKKIKDIASQCGYDNLPYFYATFKKYANCTPQEFKAKYREVEII